MSSMISNPPANAPLLPVIDMSPLFSGDETSRKEVGRNLRNACIDVGFFYIVGHGVQPDLLAKLFKRIANFFALPVPEKEVISVSHSPDFRGYTGMLMENYGAKGDLHESFDMAARFPELNQWPPGDGEFQALSEIYLSRLTDVSRLLMRGIALALDLQENYFDPMLTRPMSTVRYLHYPSQAGTIDEEQIGIGTHTDFEALTILAQDEVSALQLLDDNGEWLEAAPIAGAFVVNIGDMMERWTNGTFRSTRHRVINVSGRERYSIPFFFGPNEDTVIAALPGCASATKPAKFEPVRALDYSRGRLAEAYGTTPAG